MPQSESKSPNPIALDYARARPNNAWILITVAAIINILGLFAIANLWQPRTYAHPTTLIFGYFNYAKISTDLYNNDGPIWEWNHLIWHPAPLTITLSLTLALLTLMIWSIRFAVRRIRPVR